MPVPNKSVTKHLILFLAALLVGQPWATAVGEIKLKPLAKHFQKGINRFEVAWQDGGERKSTGVILEVQM